MKKETSQKEYQDLLQTITDNCMMIGKLFLYIDRDMTTEIHNLVVENRKLSKKLYSMNNHKKHFVD
jgi:hypothetical protein